MSVKPLEPKTHFIFWGCGIIALISIIFLLKSVLLPFILGLAVAYLLNPLVNRFGQIGIARAPAALMILCGFLILILAFVGIISPIVYRETLSFAEDLPTYIAKIIEMLSPWTEKLDQYIAGSDQKSIQDMLKTQSGSAINAAKLVGAHLASGGQAVVGAISVTVFMPIVAYYLMKEWPFVTQWVCDLMPRHSKDTIMNLLQEIDKKLSGFIRGQISVAVILGIAYAVALTIAGLKYGFFIGLMAGLLSIIPMVGSAVGLIVSITVAWFQAGELMYVGIIAAIFIAGQVIEGNFLTPKLVGDSVGLHPLWVFFALLAGGALMGITGMFLAVPVVAVLGVLISFAIYKYKQSAYYLETTVKKTIVKKTTKKPTTKNKK